MEKLTEAERAELRQFYRRLAAEWEGGERMTSEEHQRLRELRERDEALLKPVQRLPNGNPESGTRD